MDGTHARTASAQLGLTEPTNNPQAVQDSPALRLAGTSAYKSIDPTDERLGALRDACCLLARIKDEAAALELRAEHGRGDPMTIASGRSGLQLAADRLEAMIRELDEAVLLEIEQPVGAKS
jgi:hypothetical protein